MNMNAIERTERIKALVKIAVAILRRNDTGGYLILPDVGRVRAYDFRFNELTLSLRRRVDDDARETTLTAKFDGEKVLGATWTVDGFTKRSFKPGDWEQVLRRYSRLPVLRGVQRVPRDDRRVEGRVNTCP
ncbi:MAG TPA: hypothetical protein VF499_03745 [Afipia sp.]